MFWRREVQHRFFVAQKLTPKQIFMQELIKITTTPQGGEVVSARELHEFLEVQTEFPKWCSRMFEYGFIENQDFTEVIAKNDDNSKGGRNTLIEYALTIDCAKHISMLQRTDKGKQARQYFIDRDNQLRKVETLQPDLSHFTTLLAEQKNLLSQQSEMINVLLRMNSTPKKEYAKRETTELSQYAHLILDKIKPSVYRENPNAVLMTATEIINSFVDIKQSMNRYFLGREMVKLGFVSKSYGINVRGNSKLYCVEVLNQNPTLKN